jgi:hypothetical protein
MGGFLGHRPLNRGEIFRVCTIATTLQRQKNVMADLVHRVKHLASEERLYLGTADPATNTSKARCLSGVIIAPARSRAVHNFLGERQNPRPVFCERGGRSSSVHHDVQMVYNGL